MSPTYLYCLTAQAAPDPPPGTVGIDGALVRRIGLGRDGCDAWVSDVASRSIRATVERIRAHDSVVSAALDTGSTPLPARFGQTFATDEECLAALSAKKESLSAGLAGVAGMVEMTLVFRVQATTLDSSSGTAYLASLAQREHAIESLRRASRALTASLGDCVRDSAEKVSGNTVTVSHLVRRDVVDRYIERVRAAASGPQVIGPGAPYSFPPQ